MYQTNSEWTSGNSKLKKDYLDDINNDFTISICPAIIAARMGDRACGESEVGKCKYEARYGDGVVIPYKPSINGHEPLIFSNRLWTIKLSRRDRQSKTRKQTSSGRSTFMGSNVLHTVENTGSEPHWTAARQSRLSSSPSEEHRRASRLSAKRNSRYFCNKSIEAECFFFKNKEHKASTSTLKSLDVSGACASSRQTPSSNAALCVGKLQRI